MDAVKGLINDFKVADIQVLSPIMRIFINYFAIASLMGFMIEEMSETDVAKMLRQFIPVANFVSFEFFMNVFESLDCSITSSLWGKKAVVILVPVLFAMVLFIGVVLTSVIIPNVGKAEFLRGLSVGQMVLYTPTVKALLRLYKSVEVEGVKYVEADTSVIFGETDGHGGLMAFSAAYLVVFAAGIPIAITAMYKRRGGSTSADAKAMFGFLSKGYRDQWFFWELLVILRRLVCICAVVFGGYGYVKATLLVIILAIALIAHLETKPYGSALLNFYETASLTTLIASAMAGVLTLGDKTGGSLDELGTVIFTLANIIYLILVVVMLAVVLKNVGTKVAAATVGSACSLQGFLRICAPFLFGN